MNFWIPELILEYQRNCVSEISALRDMGIGDIKIIMRTYLKFRKLCGSWIANMRKEMIFKTIF